MLLPFLYSIAIHVIVIFFVYLNMGSNAQQQFQLISISRPGRTQSEVRREGRTERDLNRHEGQGSTPLRDSSPQADTQSGRSASSEETGEKDEYLLQIRRRIEGSLIYPLSLRRRGVQGEVLVKLVIDRDGRLENAEIVRSAGSDELDQMAMQAVQDIAPFPPLPEKIKKMGKLNLSVPILFKLN